MHCRHTHKYTAGRTPIGAKLMQLRQILKSKFCAVLSTRWQMSFLTDQLFSYIKCAIKDTSLVNENRLHTLNNILTIQMRFLHQSHHQLFYQKTIVKRVFQQNLLSRDVWHPPF